MMDRAACPLDVLIVGAGIAGLTAAGLLLRSGHKVRIFEQSKTLGEVGAGIQISANAGHVLDALDLRAPLLAISFTPEGWLSRGYLSGDIVNEFAIGEDHERRHGFPYCMMHRADLHALLVEAVRKIDRKAIRLGASATGYSESANGVSLHLADGEIVQGDLLIGADGVKSVIRCQIVGPDQPVYSGLAAWRGLIPADRLPKDIMGPINTTFVGPGRHMVLYWLGRQKLMNFVAPVETEMEVRESWTVRAPWSDLKADFEGWHPVVQTIIDAADRDACYRWALNIRKPVRNWRSERAVVIGDAAHPTLPFLAQGAALAIEDAGVLSRALASRDAVPDMLERFQNARFDRTARVVDGAARLAQMNHQASEKALRAAMRKGADVARERDGWLYNYNPMTVDF